MAEIRIELDHAGLRQLLRSQEVRSDLRRRSDAVAARAGNGVRARVYQGRDRVRAQVWTATQEARKAEAERRTLLTALDAARE